MPVAAGAPDLGRIAADFNAEHHRTYGHASADAPIDIVNLKLTARASGNGDAPYDPRAGLCVSETQAATRRAYFGPEHGSLDVAGDLARGAARLAAAGGAADRRGVRRDLRRPAGLPGDARLAREHRHRHSTHEGRSRHAGGDQERARVGGRRDGARSDAQRLLARRPRHDGLLDGALRPRRRAGRAGTDPRRPARDLPDDHAARSRALRRGHRAGRRLPRQRPVRLRRPAPAGPLRDPADLPRRRARGVRRDDGAPRRRRRPHARVDRRARDRDLPGRAAAAVAQALRGGPREHERDPDHREEHAPADRGDRRPARPDRRLPRGRARPDRDPRAVRHAREPPLHGRAAGAERAPDARRARGAARTASTRSRTSSTASATSRSRCGSRSS